MKKVVKKCKGNSVSAEQICVLVNFMEDHPELKKEKFGPIVTPKQANFLWGKVALELNSLISANKNEEKWKKFWNYMKSNTNAKNIQLKKSQIKTGGGKASNLPPISVVLLDENISILFLYFIELVIIFYIL